MLEQAGFPAEILPWGVERDFNSLLYRMGDDNVDATDAESRMGIEGRKTTASIRNVGIVAHVDAGKTTLTEHILYATKVIRYMGEVQDGTTVTDWTPEERERGISINAAAVNCRWKQWHINLVDTPGHIDFTAEVERTLCVMDGIVELFCAVKGVQAQSETVWCSAERYKLPALAYVNKMDREGADPDRVVKQIAERLRTTALPIQLPVGSGDGFKGTVDLLTGERNGDMHGVDRETLELEVQLARDHLVESLAEVDDQVLADYLANRSPSAETLRRALRRAVAGRRIVPVLFGSSLHNQGVTQLLDAIGLYLPNPQERAKGRGAKAEAGLLVFRIVSNPTYGRLAYARIFGGGISSGQILVNARNHLRKRIEGILKIQAAEVEETEAVVPGEIVALQGNWSKTALGDFLVSPALAESGKDAAAFFGVPRPRFPMPVFSINMEAKLREKDLELAKAVKRLRAEIPTLNVKPVEGSVGWRFSGMGELHLQVIRDRLKSEFGIETLVGEPTVEYRDSISSDAKEEFCFEKRFPNGVEISASVEVQVQKLESGQGLELDFAPLRGRLQENLIAAVRQGVMNVVNAEGSGFPMTDMRVTVLSASSKAGDAGEPALLTAAVGAMKNALARAGRRTLEPVMKLEINTPGDTLGSVIADLNARHGNVTQIETQANGVLRIVALAPLAELFGYASSLRSMSAGRGEVVAELDSYRETASQPTLG